MALSTGHLATLFWCSPVQIRSVLFLAPEPGTTPFCRIGRMHWDNHLPHPNLALPHHSSITIDNTSTGYLSAIFLMTELLAAMLPSGVLGTNSLHHRLLSARMNRQIGPSPSKPEPLPEEDTGSRTDLHQVPHVTLGNCKYKVSVGKGLIDLC
ncbi:hypothetical protein B0H66DRAFT_92993 [Apodospora peruviana]|uniref:Uncharacterized protein n=1 Tax=Apodospora peruviana TaxID=516989 RepID=A0AAE0IU53_9PEZI|nr:hypothetical protein B0H66DRAFT_92993 [Apodospora peruviana]